MSKSVSGEQKSHEVWNRNDLRLVRAAQRLIRLYDGEQSGPFWMKPESIAALIAEELNRPPEENA